MQDFADKHQFRASDNWRIAEGTEVTHTLPATVTVLVELDQEPAAVLYARMMADALPAGLQRGDTSTAIVSASRAQIAQIEQAQNVVSAALQGLGAHILYRNQRVYNGVAAQVDVDRLKAIADLPGVIRIRKLEAKSIDNSSSVKLIGAQKAWTAPSALTGRGIKIGIIDTGIDYRHATFGIISGTLPITNNNKVITDVAGFPSAKVVGGWDFAGDAYAANGLGTASDPMPDPDPMDCNGHGTHVAGTAAGFGVLASGLPYTGLYNVPLDLAKFSIGPGAAPEAELYALKVFGCSGSTDLTDAAIEWALDPDKDGDFSDRLDVINLSLGTNFGMPDDPTSVAANNAAAAGIIVVASAGNSGDTHFSVGAPAVADRVIAVAGSNDGQDVMDGLKLMDTSGITRIIPALQSVYYNYKHPTSTVTSLVSYPISNTTGCTSFTITDTNVISGNIVFLNWSHKDGDHECGSGIRMQNAFAAKARGVILSYDLPQLDITIGGTKDIPSVIVPKAEGDTLRTALKAGAQITATLSPELNGTRVVTHPLLVDASYHDSSRGVRMADGAPKPDLTAPGVTIFSAQQGSGTGGVAFNGTSMAAPHVSGQMALLRQLHPFWSVEELKALAMNTADADVRYRPNLTTTGPISPAVHTTARMGAGRIDISRSLESNVVVYNDGANGRVSLGFGAIEASAPITCVRSLRVSNKSSQPQSLLLDYVSLQHTPGVIVSIVPRQVTLGPFEETRARVTLRFDPALFEHTKDPTLEPTQAARPREWTSDESGLIRVSDGSLRSPLRVPLHATVRPVSAVTTTGFSKGQSALSIFGNTPLLRTGPNETYASHSSALELGYYTAKPFATDGTEYAQLKAVGAASDFAAGRGWLSTTLYFGVASHANWSTPSAQHAEFDVRIDVNDDGIEDYVLFNFNEASASGQLGGYNDVFVGALLKSNNFQRYVQTYTNGISPDAIYLPTFNNSVMMLPVRAKDLGLTTARTIQYQVVSYARESGQILDASPVIRFNPASPEFDMTHSRSGPPLWRSTPGDKIPVKFNGSGTFLSSPITQTHGILMLHHLNNFDQRVEVFVLNPKRIYMPMLQAVDDALKP